MGQIERQLIDEDAEEDPQVFVGHEVVNEVVQYPVANGNKGPHAHYATSLILVDCPAKSGSKEPQQLLGVQERAIGEEEV